jgi:hypothetical protein
MGIQALPTLPSNLPLDWILIGVLFVIIAAETMRSGAQKACILSLAAPIASLLYLLVSHAALIATALAQLSTPLSQALLFIGLVALTCLVIARIGLSFGSEAGAPIQAVVAGIATVAVVIAVWLQVPALDSIWHFGPQVQNIFAEQYRFWWLIGGYIALAAIRS